MTISQAPHWVQDFYRKEYADKQLKAETRKVNRLAREARKLSELRELMVYLEPLLSEAEDLRKQLSKNSANITRNTRKLMTLIKKDYDL